MPYASEAQRRAFYAMLRRGQISARVVAEFERASKRKRKRKKEA